METSGEVEGHLPMRHLFTLQVSPLLSIEDLLIFKSEGFTFFHSAKLSFILSLHCRILKNWWFPSCGAGKDSWESLRLKGDQAGQSWRKSTLTIHWEDWCWSSNTLATWCKELTHWKRPDAGKDRRQNEKGATEDEMVRDHHRLNVHEFEQILGDGERQRSLIGYSP